MSRWFSARSARRGLKLSARAAALWLCRAIGFTQGRAPVAGMHDTHALAIHSPSPCCLPATRI